MNEESIEHLYSIHNRLIGATQMTFVRRIIDQIIWDDRLIGIKGARGVGKTTLLLQHIKQQFGTSSIALYVSLDDMWFAKNTLFDLADYHYSHGGKYLFLDEVHKYPSWQTTLKNLYDSYPDLNIVYTASSMLEIDSRQGDLSRRQIVYRMAGLSFREFLEFEAGYKISPVSLPDMLKSHTEIASSITTSVKVLPLFEKYLKMGYYPFYKTTKGGFNARLQEVVRQILEGDMQAIEVVQYPTVIKIKKMLMILAESVPQTPNMNDLYRELETNREQGLRMLHTLQRAELLALLSSPAKKLKAMSKPDKVYLDNTNLMYAFSPKSDIGTIRETFFLNQLKNIASVDMPAMGDFMVDNKYTFEVGGRSKTFEQIKDLPDSYLAIDSIECGHHNRIPLYMFGMFY